MRAIFTATERHVRRRGFTLVEVLAALAFLAVVIPVALDGLRIANTAGEVSRRRTVAARIGDRVLNEWTATATSGMAASSGTTIEGQIEYRWSLRSSTWPEDGALRLVTVTVSYAVQGRDQELRLSTLSGSTTL